MQDRVFARHAGGDHLVEIGQHQNAPHHRYSEQPDKPDRGRHRKRRAGEIQRKNTAHQRHRHHAGRQQGVAQRPEIGKQQHADGQERNWHHDFQPFERVLQFTEFAYPFQPRAGRQMHLPVDLGLRLEDRTAKIAAAHRKPDRNVTRLAFTIDERISRHELDLGQLAQRHLRHAACGIGHRHRNRADRIKAFAVFGCQTHDDREIAIRPVFVQVAAHRLPADRGLNHRIDIAGRQPEARGFQPVDFDIDRGLPHRVEHRQVGNALDAGHDRFDLIRRLLDCIEVVAVDLDRVLPLHARRSLFDVVFDVLRKFEGDPGEWGRQIIADLLGQLFLGQVARPFACGFQRHIEFGVVEPGGVGAIVRPAQLADHGFHLGIFHQDVADAVGVPLRLFQTDRRRQRRADPEIAFFQLGQKFQAQAGHGNARGQQQRRHAAQRDNAVGYGKPQRRIVNDPDLAHQPGFLFLFLVAQQHGGQDRRDRERRQQPAHDPIGIRARHRAKNMAFDPGQREQRQEPGDDDRGGEKDRAVHFAGGQGDRAQFAAERQNSAHPVKHATAKSLAGILAQMAEDVFHHDHRGIDNQPEIDRADRQQIGGFAACDHDHDRKRQGKGDGHRHDHRRSPAAQKDPLHRKDQQDPARHVFQHGIDRHADQFGAVVDLFQVHAGWQDVVVVDTIDFGLDALQRRQAFLAAPHQDDALNDVVVVVLADDAQARQVAHLHRGDIAHQHRFAIVGRDHRVADVVHRMDQPDPAHHGGLRTDVDGLTADIDIGVVDRVQNLRQRQAV